MNDTRVFLDIAVGQRPPERVVIQLFANVVPKTAENFRALCTGERGIGKTTGKPLHYKGTSINCICKGSFVRGGDIPGENFGRPGDSVYGGYFEDENYQLSHSGPGVLSIASSSPNRNGTEFYVNMDSKRLLGLHLVFGKVIDGIGTLYNMEELGTWSGKPRELVQITDCGEISQDIPKQPTGLVQTTDSGGIFQDKTNNLMVSHEGEGRSNPRVFLDIAVGQRPPERVVIELFANVVPITAENFRALCTGEMGIGKTTKRPLHYKGTSIHYICKGLFAEGGAISEGKKCGESIYGGYFKDENFQLSHSAPGMLSMSNIGEDTNGSAFFITLTSMHFFDRLHVVFGKVIEGIGTLYNMDQLGTSSGKPIGLVQITDCGEISQGIPKEPTGLVQITDSGEISQQGDGV